MSVGIVQSAHVKVHAINHNTRVYSFIDVVLLFLGLVVLLGMLATYIHGNRSLKREISLKVY